MNKVLLRLTKNRQIRVCLFVLLLFACELLFVGQSKFAYAILPDTPVKFNLLKKIDLGGWTQGATITKKYFIYTETVKSDGNEYARLHRCKWPSFSSCDKTVKAKVNHANILDAKWGSNYFWVLDTRNHKTPGHHWCFDSETMKQVSDSKCGEMLPERNITKKNGGKLDSTLTQDSTQYEGYLLKMYGAPHRIEIRKNNKDVKMLRLNTPDETEGLFVDGNTGVIYFTTIHVDNKNRKQLWIYKITDYRLPPPTKKKTSSNKKSAAKNNASNSSNSQSSNSKSKNENSGQSPPRNTQDSSKNSQNNSSAPEANNDTATSGKNCVGTLIIKNNGEQYCSDDAGSGVIHVLDLIIEIMSIGVGIVGVIGIMVCGILYMTSRENEEKATKAKRRMFEIVIGLAAYAVLYAFTRWLLIM